MEGNTIELLTVGLIELDEGYYKVDERKIDLLINYLKDTFEKYEITDYVDKECYFLDAKDGNAYRFFLSVDKEDATLDVFVECLVEYFYNDTKQLKITEPELFVYFPKNEIIFNIIEKDKLLNE